jgi:hypothetical protein
MRIDIGCGTPMWLSPRHGGGVNIIQAQSRVMVSREEIPHLVRAILAVSGYSDPETR